MTHSEPSRCAISLGITVKGSTCLLKKLLRRAITHCSIRALIFMMRSLAQNCSPRASGGIRCEHLDGKVLPGELEKGPRLSGSPG